MTVSMYVCMYVSMYVGWLWFWLGGGGLGGRCDFDRGECVCIGVFTRMCVCMYVCLRVFYVDVFFLF